MGCGVALVCITKLRHHVLLVCVQRYMQCDKFHPPPRQIRCATHFGMFAVARFVEKITLSDFKVAYKT